MGLFGFEPAKNDEDNNLSLSLILEKLDLLVKKVEDVPNNGQHATSREDSLLEREKILATKEKELEEKLKALKIQESELETRKNELEKFRTELENKISALVQHPAARTQTADQAGNGTPDTGNTAAAAAHVSEPQTDQTSNSLLAKLDSVLEKVGDIEYKDKLIKDLHEDLRENKKDWTDELSKPFLNNLMKIHGMLRGVFMRFKSVKSEDEVFTKIVRELENNMLMVQDMLEEEYDLQYFEPEIGSAYSPKEHIALQAEMTDEEQKAGTICSVCYGGFRNLKNQKVVKQAKVTPYRLNTK